MIVQPKGFERCNEEIYLTDIHNELIGELLIDLHTYFYWKDFESCPICNEWLIQRSVPHATE